MRFKKIALFFSLFSAYLHQLHANDAWTNIIWVVVDHSSLEGRSSILQEPALLSTAIYKVQECKIQYRLLELHRKLQEVRPTVWPQLSVRPSVFLPRTSRLELVTGQVSLVQLVLIIWSAALSFCSGLTKPRLVKSDWSQWFHKQTDMDKENLME